MKNQMKYLFFACSWIWMLVMSACYEDKGNYDYTELPELSVTMEGLVENTWTMAQGSHVIWEPIITFAGDKANLVYEWKLFYKNPPKISDDEYEPAVILGHGPILDSVLNNPTGEYEVNFKVENTLNGVCVFLKFDLSIEYTRGIFVLDEVNGEGDIHVIRNGSVMPRLDPSKFGVVYNVYSAANDGAKILKPKFLSKRTYSSYDHVFVFTEDGGQRLNSNDFSIATENYKDMFVVGLSAPKPQAHIFAINNKEFILNDGRLHVSDFMYGMGGTFGAYVEEPAKDYVAAPFLPLFPRTDQWVASAIFDIKNHRFLTVNQFGDILVPSSETLQNINMDIQYMELGNLNHVFAVMKDKANAKDWIYEVNYLNQPNEGASVEPVLAGKYDVTEVTGMSNATHYAFCGRGAIMFYGTVDKLYSKDYANPNSGINDPKYDFKGEKITEMMIYKNDFNVEKTSTLLFVGTYKDGEGKVYMFNFNETNGTLIGDPTIYKGFGKVVDIYNYHQDDL